MNEAPASPNTGAYCRSRARLNEEEIKGIRGAIKEKIQDSVKQEDLWYGKNVKIIDGSSLSMPDTEENQEKYPQPKGQKPGCGFPVMRITVLFSLSTGVILELEKGNLQDSERALFRRQWDILQAGDVVLADTGFCGYADLYCLHQRGVDSVMRNHQCRKKGFSVVKKISQGDQIIQWHKNNVRPLWMNKKEWHDMPERFTVREIKITVSIPGFRTENITVITTLLDPEQFPKEAFIELYRRRWMAELFLRYIKIIMGMDVLRCKTPEMVHKELEMHIIAYNLIRALIYESAKFHRLSIYKISFKGAVSVVREWTPIMAAVNLTKKTRKRLMQRLYKCIADDKIPHRPNRNEPRARKRRPKNYQLLTKPRHIFKEIPHRNMYSILP